MEIKELLEGLNPEQTSAVTHDGGPLLVVAGAGTGKTTVITKRIAWLINKKKINPNEILALTFTDKAAAEMEARVDVLVPYGYTDMWVLTFHAFGEKILRRHAIELGISSDFSLLSQVEQAIFLRNHLWELPLDFYRPLSNPTKHIDAFISLFSRLKDEDIVPDELDKRIAAAKQNLNTDNEEGNDLWQRWEEIANVYRSYEHLLRQNDKLDFGDLLLLTLELFRKRPQIRQMYQDKFKYILVDEFQDTNHTQHELLKVLAGDSQNITVVGDDDQAIYAFRGAALENILEFRETFPKTKTVVLNRNYRSSQKILDASYRLIVNNNPYRLEAKYDLPKKLTGRADGHLPELFYEATGSNEVDTVINEIKTHIKKGRAYKDIAILARSHSHLVPFQQALIKAGIPVVGQERGLYEQPEIRDLISFLQVIAYPTNSLAIAQLMNSNYYLVSPTVTASINHLAKRRNRPITLLLEDIPGLAKELEIKPEEQTKLEQLKKDLDAYTAFASRHNVGETLYDYLKEKGIITSLTQNVEGNELRVRQLVSFFNRITRFVQMNTDQSVTAFVDNLSLLTEFGEDPKVIDPDPDTNAIHLLTAHASKGLEFPIVFVVNAIVDRFPSRNRRDAIEIPPEILTSTTTTNDESLEHLTEERRLFYVAMTRAKEYLYLSLAADYGGTRVRKPSPFILEAMDLTQLEPPITKTKLEEQLSLFAPATQTQQPTNPKINVLSPLETDGTLVLTTSKIEDYLECPAKFRALHLLHLPIIQNHSMVYGNAIHAGIQSYYQAKIEGREATYELMRSSFEKTWLSEGFLSRSHEDMRFETGLETLHKFYEKDLSEPKKPISVEESFRFPYSDAENVIINGRFDCVYDLGNNQREITDFKTSFVTTEKDALKRAKDSLQLMVYSLAYESLNKKLPALVSLSFVETGLIGQFAPTPKQIIKAKDTINEAIDGIRSGYFGPGKGSHSCEWCEGLKK